MTCSPRAGRQTRWSAGTSSSTIKARVRPRAPTRSSGNPATAGGNSELHPGPEPPSSQPAAASAPGGGGGPRDWWPAPGVSREAPRPGLCPFGPQPSRPRRESCCSTLRNAEPKRRREEATGDYGESRRGPRRDGARRTSPKCKQRTGQGKRRHPTSGPSRSREVTTTRAAAGAARGCDGPSRAPAPGAALERGAEAGPRTRQEQSPSSEDSKAAGSSGFSHHDRCPTPKGAS